MDPAPEDAYSSAVEPNTDSTSKEIYVDGPPGLRPAVGSGPYAPGPIESDWAPVMEFTAADIFQHLPFGDMLFIKVSLFVRRLLAELCPARVRSRRRGNSLLIYYNIAGFLSPNCECRVLLKD